MKTYAGFHHLDPGHCVIVTHGAGPKQTRLPRQLDARRDLCNHSPDGFAWGYGGSGPAQLALALCADVLDDDLRAQRVYQRFKEQVVACLDGDCDWAMTDAVIRQQIDLIDPPEEVPA